MISRTLNAFTERNEVFRPCLIVQLVNAREASEARVSSINTGVSLSLGREVVKILTVNKGFYPQHEITLLGSLNYRKTG